MYKSTLLDFPLLTGRRHMVVKTSKREAEEPNSVDTVALRELGRLLGETLTARGVTERKLAQLAGVSRSNIRFAKQGANVTVLTLVKLARALDMRSIAIGALTLTSAAIPQALEAAKEFEEAATHLQAAAKILRELTGATAEESPAEEETVRNAAALARDVLANAKALGAERLGVLDETFRELVANVKQTAVETAAVKPRGPGWRQTK
jgi:transcriptional regulator with XRE-family HTH domain